MARLGLLIMGRKRPGFDPEWGGRMEALAKQMLNASSHELVYCERPAVDDATLREALSVFKREGVDAPLLLQPTMSDGRLAPRLGQLWPGPVVLWATPEDPGSSKVSSCSLVGTHVFAANLRQLGRPFELLCGMPGEPETARELDAACQAVAACKKLHAAKVGLVGYHAPGFIDMHADPVALSEQTGVELFHTGVQELLDRMKAVAPEDVEADVATVLAMGLPLHGVSREDLATPSRFYLAVKELVREECLDALAVREWPELPNLTGHWPYLSICRLLGDGIPISCEGDVDGALVSLMGCLLGAGPGYLTDWLEHDDQTITVWHGGCAPLDLCEPIGAPKGPNIGRHFNSDKPAVVNAALAADKPVTLCRLWRCDETYFLMTEEAVTAPPKRRLAGTTGVVQLNGRDPRAWFRELCFAGMPHHLTVFPGHCGDMFNRLARLLGVQRFT